MHMNERKSLRHENLKEIIRPTMVCRKRTEALAKHYTNAIWWWWWAWETSDPFPAKGLGSHNGWAEWWNNLLQYQRFGLRKVQIPKLSSDGGTTWKRKFKCLPVCPQNTNYGCMAGLTRLAITGKDILIYSNCDSPAGRKQGTVWASFDGGKSWPIKRLVFAGSHAYSSISSGRPTTISEGMIYHHFEGGPKGGSAVAKFNLSWILAGEETGDGEVPSWVK